MVIRVTVANIEPLNLAKAVQAHVVPDFATPLSATVFQSWGAGSWGVEPGATAEFAGAAPSDVREFILGLLKVLGERAAYVTSNGHSPRLWWSDGRVEGL